MPIEAVNSRACAHTLRYGLHSQRIKLTRGKPKGVKFALPSITPVNLLPKQARAAVRADQAHPKVAEAAKPDLFQWTQQWYPVASVSGLDPSRPNPTTLLGKNLVLWRDRDSGAWCCFEDKCPHRLAPLSEGRIDEARGTLMCGYHGWQFEASGTPVCIPQDQVQLHAKDERAEKAAIGSPQACAKLHPTQVKQGLVWVWAESGGRAMSESKLKEPLINKFREAHEADFVHQYCNYVRDMPGGYAVWVENSFDQSHVAFAHHGLVGRRGGEKEGYFASRAPSRPAADPFSLTFDFDFSTNGERVSTARLTFCPPTLLLFEIEQMPNTQLWLHVVPVSPSCTRLIVNNGGVDIPLPLLLKKLRTIPAFLKLSDVLSHLQLNAVNDGDIIFMHEQHNNTYTGGHGTRPAYFMPSESDRGVALWLKWLAGKGGGGPPYGGAETSETMRDELGKLKRATLLDRYKQHTQGCGACSKALRQVRLFKTLLLLLLGGEALVAAVMLSRAASGLTPQLMGLSLAMTLSALGLRALSRFERSFIFTDWQQQSLLPMPRKK